MSMVDPVPHIYEFSAGYYLVEGFYVEPNDEIDVPMVQDHIYGYLQDKFYEARPTPMLLRHNESKYHFQIHPSENVNIDTIEMPFELVDDMLLDRFPDEEQFLLAKPRHAHNLYRLSNPDTTTIEG